MLFDRGLNVKQVQRWLGHHSAGFTLDTYIHLLADEAFRAGVMQAVGRTSTADTRVGSSLRPEPRGDFGGLVSRIRRLRGGA